MTRRDYQAPFWYAWDDDPSRSDLDRVRAGFRANRQGLTDYELELALGESHQNASARRRDLVKLGEVSWTRTHKLHPGHTVRQRVWALGVESPAERAGSPYWPPVYGVLRALVEDPSADLQVVKPRDLARAVHWLRQALGQERNGHA